VPEPAKPETVPVVPVVIYYRRVGPVDNPERSNVVLKEVDGKIAEYFKNNEPVAQPIGKQIVPEWCRRITPAEYAAAKCPDHIRGVTEMVRAIEPLDPMAGTLERTEKINELVAWINAKGAV
jgi:hypothetical protein